MRRIFAALLVVLAMATMVSTASAQINGGITMMTTRTLKAK